MNFDKKRLISADLYDHLERYLQKIMSVIRNSYYEPPSTQFNKRFVADQIFSVLTSRQFCYLSKIKSSKYAEQLMPILNKAIKLGEPLSFFYDIGGGYHASVKPGQIDLVFDIGLAELLVLYQIASFCNQIHPIYSVGAKFHLVVDNVCAFVVNGTPIEKTMAYCHAYRFLIASLNMSDRVDLLVESEHFSPTDYDSILFNESFVADSTEKLSKKSIDNVSRFIGCPSDNIEAQKLIIRYKIATNISEHLLGTLVQGIHMTQRATETTLSFRPFPGGDSRIQCGKVGITRNTKDKLQPILLTSNNINYYLCNEICFPWLLPSSIKNVTYAEKIN